ncbi:MAG TPA: prepilin-type N-terminal cleavage/methylation domain-containing protein [Myxococcales bacterium]|jgi:type IV pilus assembly protein PilW
MKLSLASPSAARHARGFTLIELLVGTVVSSIVVLGVASAFVGINASYQSESKIKVAVENSRNAQVYLERTVHMAGYGIDPRYAFDFSTGSLGTSYGGLKDNFPATPTTFATDDLAFRYRDPSYMRRGIITSSGNKISLDTAASFGVSLRTGQVMVVACANGGEYVVVKTTEPKAATEREIATTPYSTPFSSSVPNCTTNGANTPDAAFVFLLYELRLRVKLYDNKPYLVAFNSFDNPDTADFVVIAAGVENFQVAYVMNRPLPAPDAPSGVTVPDSSTNSNWIIPDVSGEGLPDPGADAPLYATPNLDPPRYSKHPANIRAVRVTMVVRNSSTLANLKYPRTDIENQAKFGADDGYFRTVISTTISTPNMKSRAFFVPAVGDIASGLNIGGG